MNWFFTGSLFKAINETPVKNLTRLNKHRGALFVVRDWLKKKRVEWRAAKKLNQGCNGQLTTDD
jgi:hypothetical protein